MNSRFVTSHDNMAPRIEIGVFETYELRSTEVRQHKENKGDCNGDGGRATDWCDQIVTGRDNGSGRY